MTTEPEKLDLKSMDLAAEKQAELLRLLPEIRTEGSKIDFDRLKLALGEAVDVGRERYGLTWPGKADCFKTIQAPSFGTLRPAPKESVNFDTTENLIIEGDNLEVLKLLQKSYLGKVKMIYIDPPYNTGNDFIYPDNFGENLQTYLEYTGQVDSEGRKFGTNTETEGRFHSKWLNMLFPRLYLARNLLRDDGVIWVSIDDTEFENLRRLMNEVFGEDNFVATFVWEKRRTRENRRVFSFNHDFIVCFARSKPEFEAVRKMLPLTEEARARYNNPDNDPRGDWQSVALTAQAGHGTPSQFYTIVTPTGREVDLPPGNCWRVTKVRLDELIADNRIWFGSHGNNVPRRKVFLNEQEEGLTPHTLWTADEVGTTDSAKRHLNALFGEDAPFETPKPVELLTRILEISTDSGDLVLDFFAGSGTTGEAVLRGNSGGEKVQFILVQLPEPTGNSKYPTISEITKERVRKVVKAINEEDSGSLDLSRKDKQDLGFKVFKLDQSNFMGWDAGASTDADALGKQLDLSIDHVRQSRTDDDLFYELLLKSGFPLTMPVEKLNLAGKTVFSIGGGVFLICLERDLTLEAIRAMADMKPSRVVCLDDGFRGNDQLKSNAVLTFKTKGVAKFQTV